MKHNFDVLMHHPLQFFHLDKWKTPVWLKKTTWAILALVVLFNIVFLLYPRSSALPFAKISNISVAGLNDQEIKDKLSSIQDQLIVEVKAEEEARELTFADLGMRLDTDLMSRVALEHKEQWYMPVFSWWSMFSNNNSDPVFIVDDEKFEDVFKELVEEFGEEPADAEVLISDSGIVTIKESVDGSEYNIEGIRQNIISQLSLNSQTVDLQSILIVPRVTTSEAQVVANDLTAMIDTSVTVKAKDYISTPTSSEKAAWVFASENEEGKLTAQLDYGAVNAYLQNVAAVVDETPVNTVVTVVDGVETSRDEGDRAEVLDIDQSANAIISAIEQSAGVAQTVDLPFITIDPKVVYNSSYSASNAGLQKLLQDWDKDYPGDYGVVISQIGGSGYYAYINANKSYVTASTYKMFIAYYVLNEIDNGNLEFDDPSGRAGWTVDECLVQMITISTNVCAIELQNKFGWAAITSHIQSVGFTSTNINNQNGGSKTTTPADEANFLIKLNNGQLLSSSSTNYLLDLMQRQIYRSGLPAGSNGSVVANKVGFFDGYLHDVGIVYSTNGTYVITVLSRWGAYHQYADLADRVYNFMN